MRRQLPAAVAFPAVSFIPFAFFAAASAPSPVFILLQRAWGFSATMLTVAFAVYGIALLLSLLTAGSLSDHVGRRPVLLAALLMEAAAMVMFLFAEGIGGLIAARLAQGVATGLASGAMTAAVVEAAPATQKRFGALVGSTAPLAGLSMGALLTGTAIRYTTRPLELVFGALATAFAVGACIMWYAPETVTPRPGALASLKPRVGVPARARREFARGVPLLIAVWALSALYLSLVPSLLPQAYGIDNGFVNGLAIALLTGCGAMVPPALRGASAERTALLGAGAIVVGVVCLIASLESRSVAWFFVGTVIAGMGFGGAFSGVVQMLAPLAEAHERGELFASIFVVSYLSLSVPAVAAGLLVKSWGLAGTVSLYEVLLALVAAVGFVIRLWRRPAAAGA